jgi:hypothetical protein
MGPQDRLISYVKAQRGKPFAIGSHDCLTFTNGAWNAMHGRGYADQIIGKYTDLGQKALAKLIRDNFGTPDMIAALDAGLTRVNGFPPKGALVVRKADRQYFTGYAFGIAMGVTAVFLGERDVVYMPISQIEGAWV